MAGRVRKGTTVKLWTVTTEDSSHYLVAAASAGEAANKFGKTSDSPIVEITLGDGESDVII